MRDYGPGDLIDDQFEVVEVAGSGGFATVYRVLNQADDREYALKLLGRRADLTAVRREFAPLRRIRHPNVVSAHWAARTSDGYWYVATDYVAGENARALIKRDAPLEPTLFFTLGDQLLAALRAMHGDDHRRSELENQSERTYEEHQELEDLRAAATVHRDIKPENLIIRPTGDLVLVDFGIASFPGAEIRHVTETPEYVPPDISSQLQWNPDIDRYATGMALFEFATGAAPSAAPVRVTETLADELLAFLTKASAPDRANRFATTNDMFDAWQSIPRSAVRRAKGGETDTSNSDSEFTAWPMRPLPPADSMTQEELTTLIEEIVEDEGPVLCRRVYDLIEAASGSRPLSALNVATHRAVQAGRLGQVERIGGGQQNKTVYAPEGDPFVRRTLGTRDPSDVPACEFEAWAEWNASMFGEDPAQPEATAERIAWFMAGDQADSTVARLRYRLERTLMPEVDGSRFYVYENWTNTFTKVHRADCPYCNDGNGIQGRGSSTPSGRWHGPFADDASAFEAAQEAADRHSNRNVWEVGRCGYCGGVSR